MAAFLFAMNHIQLSIRAAGEQQDILIGRLSDLGAVGFEQTDDYLVAYFEEHNFASYDVQQVLQECHFEMMTVEERNWNAVWESNFAPVQVEGFCAVRAHFHPPITDVLHEILITPKMSFGTGHHATTYMMMEQMQHMDFSNRYVFDFGTGTGILAILAEKLGAGAIDAIDVDDWSIENAAENFERNGCTRIRLQLSSHVPAGPFDLILANINKNVILKQLKEIAGACKKGTQVLLSGLLASDEAEVVAACSALGLQLQQQRSRENWIALLFRFGG